MRYSSLLLLFLVVAALRAQVPTGGLVAFYPFSGNANDSSGNGINGTLNGCTLTTDRFGRPNSAYQFNGSSDYILVNNSSSFPATAITTAFWLNRMGIGTTGLENYVCKEHSFSSYLYSDSSLVFQVWKGTAGVWSEWSTGYYRVKCDSNWVFYASTYDNATKIVSVYINGVLVNTVNETDPQVIVRTSTDQMYIGRNGSSSVYFIKGKLDDVRIYNRALSAGEISQLYGNYYAPKVLMADADSGKVVLRWSSERKSDIARYRIYRGGALIDSVIVTGSNDTSYTNLGLTNYQPYSFFITSVDNYGNMSRSSDTVTATPCLIVSDYDGNRYQTTKIGNQIWMLGNLKITHYRNGNPIQNVMDQTAWIGLTSGAFCWFNNDSATYKSTYGALYNFYAVLDSRNLCPPGWHVASDNDWKTLESYLGMATSELDLIDQERGAATGVGGQMKESGTLHWASPNSGATNASGFMALPGGQRNGYGVFMSVGSEGIWHTSTAYDPGNSIRRRLGYGVSTINRYYTWNICGYGLRLVKDDNNIVSAGLVAWYPFNGNANDSSGNGNNGTNYDATLTNDRFGNPNSAYLFNGSSNYILVNNSATFPDTAITTAFWFNRNGNAPTSLENYICKETSFSTYLYSDSTLVSQVWKGTAGVWSEWSTGNYKVSDDTDWIFYASTFSNSTKLVNIYINGVLVNSITETDPTAIVRSSTNPLYIGRNGSSSVYYIKGKLDDIRIYNRALDSSEIQLLHHEGGRVPTDVKGQIAIELPGEYRLAQNYPNPFNPSTTIEYALPNRSNVRIVITNMLGQQVALLVNGEQEAGYHEIKWQASIASGIYFYRFEAVDVTNPNNRFVQVKKMLLLK